MPGQLIAYFQCLYICRYLSLYRYSVGLEKKTGVDMRNYCEYLQGNYFVLTEVVVVVISRETFHVLHHVVAYEMQ